MPVRTRKHGVARGAILIFAIAWICAARQASEFVGTWVMNFRGQPVFKLTLSAQRGRLGGSLTTPKGLSIDSDGEVIALGPDQIIQPVQRAKLKNDQLELVIDGDSYVMALQGSNQASLVMQGTRPLPLERIADGKAVVLASSLAEPDYPQEIRELREHLRAMLKEDQEARQAFADARIEETDVKNRPQVLAIFDRYGWVTYSLAGREAEYIFWVLVQHQKVEIWQRFLPALEKAAKSGDASMRHYVSLYDGLQRSMGKPQRWGTQTICVNGKPGLYEVDDPAGLDARRKELFMQPVNEFLKTEYLVKLCR
jgi:hypothetical protein